MSTKIEYLNMYKDYKDYTTNLNSRIKDIDTNCNTIFKLLRDLGAETWWNKDNDKKIVRGLLSTKNYIKPKDQNHAWNLIRESQENHIEFEGILKMLITLCENQKKNRNQLHKIISEATKKFGISVTKKKSKSLETIDEGDKRRKRKNKSGKSKKTKRVRKRRKSRN